MLLAISVILWSWGLLSRRPMLCRQGMQKGRCCVLFSDLKVFLLRPPTPSAPPPALPLMSGQNTESHVTDGAVERNNSSTEATESSNGCLHHPAGWTEHPSSREDVGTKEEMGGEWESTTVELTGTLECGSSSEDCSKEKYDDRTSLNSCTDSGVRSPLCRICFQGPEQVSSLRPLVTTYSLYPFILPPFQYCQIRLLSAASVCCETWSQPFHFTLLGLLHSIMCRQKAVSYQILMMA